MDMEGQAQWAWTGSFSTYSQANALVKLTDGALLVVGTVQQRDLQKQGFVARLGEGGDQEWVRLYGAPAQDMDPSLTDPIGARELPDGLLVVGSFIPPRSSGEPELSSLWVMRAGADGRPSCEVEG